MYIDGRWALKHEKFISIIRMLWSTWIEKGMYRYEVHIQFSVPAILVTVLSPLCTLIVGEGNGPARRHGKLTSPHTGHKPTHIDTPKRREDILAKECTA